MQRAKIEEQRRSAQVKQAEKVIKRRMEILASGEIWSRFGEGARNDGRMSAPSLRQWDFRVSLPHDILSAMEIGSAMRPRSSDYSLKKCGLDEVCAGTTLRIWVLFNDKQKLMQADHWLDRSVGLGT